LLLFCYFFVTFLFHNCSEDRYLTTVKGKQLTTTNKWLLNPVSSFLTIFGFQSNRTGIGHVRLGLFTEAIECAGRSSNVLLSPRYIPQGRNCQARDPSLIVSFPQMGHCCLRDHTGSPKPMAVEPMGQSNQVQPHKTRGVGDGHTHSTCLKGRRNTHALVGIS